jgi:long-chain acyl-CoA synthetase
MLTYAQLSERAARFALWLRQEVGLAVGDHVGLVSKNRADWDVALWGTMLAGAVPVLIDPDRGPHGVIGHLDGTDCKALVLSDEYGDESTRGELFEHAGSKQMTIVMMAEAGLPGADSADDADLAAVRNSVDADDTAVILCTSGTTGDPREVELSHANLIANIQGSVKKVDITQDDVLGHILPPHHSFGLTVGKFLPLTAGATNIYTKKYREVSDLIRDRQVTIFIGIPALFTTLAKKIEEALAKHKEHNPLLRQIDRHLPQMVGKKIRQRQGWTHLRFFLSGAAPMPRWVLDVLWRRGFRMYEGYGTTENSPVYGFNDRPDKLGSVGRPIDTLSVKVVDEDNQTLPPGERGEICLGGPCIMKGYYGNAAATAAVIDTDEQGTRWLHTGDLGYLGEDGDLFITGRKKYLIILPGGKNVNPERVETALSEARFVKEVLLVPNRKHDANGIMEETMRALVQPAWDSIEDQTGQPQRELADQPQLVKNLVWESIRDCQQQNKQLSSFEKIAAHHLEIHTDEFVKTSTGKIKREHYINLEHLEAKHTPVAEVVAVEGRNRATRDANAQPDGN